MATKSGADGKREATRPRKGTNYSPFRADHFRISREKVPDTRRDLLTSSQGISSFLRFFDLDQCFVTLLKILRLKFLYESNFFEDQFFEDQIISLQFDKWNINDIINKFIQRESLKA